MLLINQWQRNPRKICLPKCSELPKFWMLLKLRNDFKSQTNNNFCLFLLRKIVKYFPTCTSLRSWTIWVPISNATNSLRSIIEKNESDWIRPSFLFCYLIYDVIEKGGKAGGVNSKMHEHTLKSLQLSSPNKCEWPHLFWWLQASVLLEISGSVFWQPIFIIVVYYQNDVGWLLWTSKYYASLRRIFNTNLLFSIFRPTSYTQRNRVL